MTQFSKSRILLITAGSALAAAFVAGCSHDDSTPPATVNSTTNVTPPAAAPGVAGTNTTTVVPGATTTVEHTSVTPSTNNTNAGAGGATGTQTAVADAVNKAIHNNAQMTGSRVTAVVNASGAARLTGTAQNAQQKGLAESTARQTAGVSSVINKIEIVATGGVKSAVQPSGQTKTKIIVVHDKSSDASSPDTSASDSTGAKPDASTGAGAPVDSSTTANTDTTTTTTTTNTKGQ